MQRFSLIYFIAFITLLAPANKAQNACQKQSIEQLAGSIAQNYESKSLSRLDPNRPYLSKYTLSIENSLVSDGEPDQFEIKRFKSFRVAEKWLKSREFEGWPNRISVPLTTCKKGICRFNLQGINHKQLFLQKISYGYQKNGCPFVKTIFLLDGN